jgi:hypothetical protein
MADRKPLNLGFSTVDRHCRMMLRLGACFCAGLVPSLAVAKAALLLSHQAPGFGGFIGSPAFDRPSAAVNTETLALAHGTGRFQAANFQLLCCAGFR